MKKDLKAFSQAQKGLYKRVSPKATRRLGIALSSSYNAIPAFKVNFVISR